jgi:hypothetical protein
VIVDVHVEKRISTKNLNLNDLCLHGFFPKEIFKKTRPLFLFIFIGLFFYLFVFDFSIGALDRYFQFLVIPLCVISGAVFARMWSDKNDNLKKINTIENPMAPPNPNNADSISV